MPVITYAGKTYELAPGETVLDALLRQGNSVSHSCRTGACQTCMLRAKGGTVPTSAQQGLKPALVEQGYFLSCVCRPEQDLQLESAAGLDVEATLHSLELLTPTVLKVALRPAMPFAYRAGQYVTLRRGDGLARSYSLASLPGEELLELHVRRVPRGRMSGWLFDEARAGDVVTIRGPAGDCFYTAGKPDQPLLLAGTGTGLAPLLGICWDAVQQGHRGPIHLYHGALNPGGLYGTDVLQTLTARHPHVQYRPVVLEGEAGTGVAVGELDKVILAAHPKLSGWRGFVCGDPGIVQLLKKKLFLAGMASRDISADAFVESAVV
ncbi:MAG TPA: 2Fe-2S iron-sulfur cluster-binding protein [Gemmatales bacterium]|nr:2Fe-2S iron-sulfur cluster-binding protein [Gemmatales bacterium]